MSLINEFGGSRITLVDLPGTHSLSPYSQEEIAVSILAWLLYHSIWKKKWHCHGCDGGSCDFKRKT